VIRKTEPLIHLSDDFPVKGSHVPDIEAVIAPAGADTNSLNVLTVA
jgi:hypothetical protein